MYYNFPKEYDNEVLIIDNFLAKDFFRCKKDDKDDREMYIYNLIDDEYVAESICNLGSA